MDKKLVWVYCIYECEMRWVMPVYIREWHKKIKLTYGKTSIPTVVQRRLRNLNELNIPNTPKTMFNSNDNRRLYVWLEDRDDEWVKNIVIDQLQELLASTIKDITILDTELWKLKRKCEYIRSSLKSICKFGTEESNMV